MTKMATMKRSAAKAVPPHSKGGGARAAAQPPTPVIPYRFAIAALAVGAVLAVSPIAMR